jgi:hypothetical protein
MRLRFLLAVAIALTTFGTATAQQVYSIYAPPADISTHLGALRAGKERGAALRALAARDEAAPTCAANWPRPTTSFFGSIFRRV